MNTFLETLRAKPEHVRRQIAMFGAIGITSVITLGWGAAVLTSGKLALATDFSGTETALGETTKAKEETTAAFGSLLGATSAAFGSPTTASTDVSLSVVDEDSSSTLERTEAKEERTVIPF